MPYLTETEYGKLQAELHRQDQQIGQLRSALVPFAAATVTPDGQIIGLMREHLTAAQAALTTTN